MSEKNVKIKPVVGLTGTIGSGKSTAAALFAKKKIPVIDADQICAGLFEAGSPLLGKIQDYFGEETILPDGSYNRPYIRSRIESSPEDQRQLNAITHPAIKEAVDEAIEIASRTDAPFVLYDCPLLFESGEDSRCALKIVVSVPEEIRIKRLMERDGIDYAAAKARSVIQMDESEKIRRSEIELVNDGSPKALEEKIEELIAKLLKKVL